jgi:hypothetical protein
LIPTEQYRGYIAVLRTLRHFRRGSWLKHHEITEPELDAILDALPDVLSDQPMTREALADTLAAHVGNPAIKERLLSGWGALLKPASFQGLLCYGPNDGQNVTFVNPAAWLDPQDSEDEIDSEAQIIALAQDYLLTMGATTPDEFARWVGVTPAQAKKAFRALGDSLVEVNVEGWEASMQVLTLDYKLESRGAPPKGVRLLPYFDPYTVHVRRHADRFLPEAHHKLIYRPQGWIYPVVLVDGRMAGVWSHEVKRDRLIVSAEMFDKADDRVRRLIDDEAARLATFLGAREVEVSVTTA